MNANDNSPIVWEEEKWNTLNALTLNKETKRKLKKYGGNV